MIKTSHTKFLIPLAEKIKILGIRVETSDTPEYRIEDKKLKVFDEWNIQVISIPSSIESQNSTPSLIEHKLSWEEEYDWDYEYPFLISINYKRKPQNTSIHIFEKDKIHQLSLFFETLLDIEFTTKKTPTSNDINKSNTKFKKQIEQLEKEVLNLKKMNTELEKKVIELSTVIKTSSDFCRIEGKVLDSFRMLPIPKAILEFYAENTNEPIIKIATDNQGKYCTEDLKPGSYELRIKRSRYLPLIVKNYVLKEKEQKYQDFLLRMG